MATTHARPIRRGPELGIAAGAAVSRHAPRLLGGFSPEPAAAAVSPQPAYGWPVKPFHRQHPVRAFFGDPRIGGRSHSFHFGVDISCPDGTPVYATITRPGVHLAPPSRDGVGDRRHGDVEFGYWHIVPTVRSGQRVTAYRTVIGKVASLLGARAFRRASQRRLRQPAPPGAMGPYTDTTVPDRPRGHRRVGRRYVACRRRACARGRARAASTCRRGLRRDADPDLGPLARQAADPGAPPVEAPGRQAGGRRAGAPRSTSGSPIRRTTLWGRTYTSWTRQNKKIWDARYGFYLAHGFDTRALRDGTYLVQVKATDIRGNSGTTSFPLRGGQRPMSRGSQRSSGIYPAGVAHERRGGDA